MPAAEDKQLHFPMNQVRTIVTDRSRTPDNLLCGGRDGCDGTRWPRCSERSRSRIRSRHCNCSDGAGCQGSDRNRPCRIGHCSADPIPKAHTAQTGSTHSTVRSCTGGRGSACVRTCRRKKYRTGMGLDVGQRRVRRRPPDRLLPAGRREATLSWRSFRKGRADPGRRSAIPGPTHPKTAQCFSGCKRTAGSGRHSTAYTFGKSVAVPTRGLTDLCELIERNGSAA